MTVSIRRYRPKADRAVLSALQATILPYDIPITVRPIDLAWVAWRGSIAVGFAVLRPVTSDAGFGYLARAGVAEGARGHGLQRRLIRVREAAARRLGWTALVSDTSRINLASSNSLIREGYKLYAPAKKWGFKDGNYWLKWL